MTRRVLGALAGVALAAGAPGLAQAYTLFEATPGDPGTHSTSVFSHAQYVAGYFEVAAPTTLSLLEINLRNQATVLGSVTAAIFADGPDGPGTLLYSAEFDLPAEMDFAWVGAYGLDWDLEAGSYWAGFIPNADVKGAWRESTVDPVSEYALGSNGNWSDDWTRLYVPMRAEGDLTPASVPAPAAAWLLLGGAGALVAMRRRERG